MPENDIFKALADPTRRSIFEKLAAGSMHASALREGTQRVDALKGLLKDMDQ
jgi:DNA-binding transcriptional ArsR family regulator